MSCFETRLRVQFSLIVMWDLASRSNASSNSGDSLGRPFRFPETPLEPSVLRRCSITDFVVFCRVLFAGCRFIFARDLFLFVGDLFILIHNLSALFVVSAVEGFAALLHGRLRAFPAFASEE
jgi:hypothetical protein